MTLKEFRTNHYLHDSSLVKVEYDAIKNTLALTIYFCFWMQLWYDKNEPPNGFIRVTFKDVSRFEYDDCIAEKIFGELDSEIRFGEIDSDGNFILFAVEAPELDDDDDIYFQITICAADVEVVTLKN